MSLADLLSSRRHALRFRGGPRRRRAHALSRFVPQVSPLEDRCLLTSALLGSETLVNATLAGRQQLSADGGRSIDVTSSGTVIAAWSSTGANGSRIVARRIGPDGSPLGGEIAVSTAKGGLRGHAVVATNASGQFVVAWASHDNPQDPSGSGVFARVFSPDGKALTREFRVNASVLGNQLGPSIAWLSADRFVVAWDGAGKDRGQTVFARVFSASGTPVTKEVLVPRTHAGTKQDAVVVALPDGGFEVAWSGKWVGTTNDIFARRFNASGKPLGPQFRVNTSRAAADNQPAMAVNGDQVVIAWQTLGDALDRSRTGVVARRFALDGTPLGGEFLVNQTTQGRQYDPSVALINDGSIVVAWRGKGTGDNDGVFVREFFEDGTPRAGEQRMNTTVAGTQKDPTVRAQSVGRYVVAWDGNVRGAASGEVKARKETGDGSGIAVQEVGDTYINIPTDSPGKTINDVLCYDASATDPKFMKTIIITNNSPDKTIYPFYEDANNRTALPTDPAPSPTYRGTGMFDPFDPLNHEFRAYIGFHDATGDHLGLLPGKSITINVPLAFWDAGRINFTTDGAISKGGSDLLGPDPTKPVLDQKNQPNPFRFFYDNPNQNVVGSTTPGSTTLTFTRIYDSFQDGKPYTDPNKKLLPSTIVPGMGVSGPGIPENDTVFSLGADGNSINLSIPAIQADPNDPTNTVQTNVPYTFTAGTTISPTVHVTVDALSGPNYPNSITNGRVMFYHALAAVNPVNDAPFQLSEPTMRGDYYAPANNPGFQYLIGFDYEKDGKKIDVISANDFNLINYDVSYVDSMAFPIGVSADNVPVVWPNPNNLASYPYGWAGSSQTNQDMKAAIDAFTSTNKNGQNTNFLDGYFGGKGWPKYYNPNTTLDFKIPSGQNIFKESPFLKSASSYPVKQFFEDGTSILLPVNQLTSGGSGPAFIAPGGNSNSPNLKANQVLLNNSTDADKALLVILRDQFNAGQTYNVTSSKEGNLDPDLPQGTTLSKVLTADGTPTGTPTGVVELSNDTIAANRGLHVYTFARPLKDDAATPIMTLWYSWSQFYADYVKNTLGVTAPFNLTGQINPAKAEQIILNPNQPNATKVQPGMGVGGNGGIPGTGCIVLAVSGNTITLSKAAIGQGSYTFTPPDLSALAGYKDKGTTWDLLSKFQPEGDGPAVDFSQTIYSVMASMSTTVSGASTYPSVDLLAHIIGATVSLLPNQNTDIQVFVTNQIKSLLRGVPDWTIPKYSDQSQWYPDPAVHTGGQQFNVYNLDPFVWFVHEKLGLSGYGFSIDDDTSDIGANGSRHLDLAFGGITDQNGNLNGVKNSNEWTTVAYFGPVKATGTVVNNPDTPYPPGLTKITGLSPTLVNQLVGYNQPNNTVGTLVNGKGVKPGTTVVAVDAKDGWIWLSDPVTVQVGTEDPFSFFGPLVARANVGTSGLQSNQIFVQDQAAYNTLQNLGPLTQVQVTGPGIQPGTMVTVASAPPGTARIVTLSEPLNLKSKPGSYAFTFGHPRPYTPPGA